MATRTPKSDPRLGLGTDASRDPLSVDARNLRGSPLANQRRHGDEREAKFKHLASNDFTDPPQVGRENEPFPSKLEGPTTEKTGSFEKGAEKRERREGVDGPRPVKPNKMRHRPRWQRLLIRTLKLGAIVSLLAMAVGMIALTILIKKLESELPSVSELKNLQMPQVTRIYGADNSVLAELVTERRTMIKINELPAHVKLAVLAAEDANFYEHTGLNYLGIARAVWVNLRHKKTKQGASTITQQVVKNLLLTSERTYTRKLKEALLARRIEQELTKDEILELYLNHIYFGAGRYGIEEAARGYFGKHAKDMTLAEAALLAGLPASPNGYNPRNDPDASVRRRGYVLNQLLVKGFVKAVDYDRAIVEPVTLAPVVEANEELAPELVELVRKTIREVAGEAAARKGGFSVYTTIDPKLQASARAAVREATSAYDKRWKHVGPFAPAPFDGRDPKTKKKLPTPEPAFTGMPMYGHGKVYLGVVTGHDDESRTMDVRVGDVLGVLKLEAKDRYNPTNARVSMWAPIGTRLRVSLLAPPAASAAASGSVAGATSHSALSAPLLGSVPPPPVAPSPSPPVKPVKPAPSAKSAGSAKGAGSAKPSVSSSALPSAKDESSASVLPTLPTLRTEVTKVPLRLELGPEAALVSIDVRTRKVIAWIGNVEGAVGGLDRALHAHRQPGSTFKPFVYGAAIAGKKITAASLIDASPGDFGGFNPKNSEPWSKDEPVRVRDAIAASLNLVAVRVAKEAGLPAIIDLAKNAGIASPMKPDLALALGAYEVTPMELATAYATLASGGVFEQPTIIARIVGPDGKDLVLPVKKASIRALGAPESYIVTSLLTSVVEKGTAQGAKVLNQRIAGKTGTSNQAKDTWFAGYTTDIVTVAWVGFDDARPLGYGEFGGKTALPAWVSFMKDATKGKPRVEFPMPPGITTIKIDPKTGKLPYPDQEDGMDEVFLAGTEPTEAAPIPEDKVDKSGEKPGEKLPALPPPETPEDPWKTPP